MKKSYQIPTLDIIELEVEQGFAASASIQSLQEDEELSY